MRPHRRLPARIFSLRWPSAREAGIFAGLVAVALIPLIGWALLLQNNPPNTPRNVPEFINRPPDFSDQMRMRQQGMSEQRFAAINAIRKQQVTDDSAKLLKMATDLKEEVEKSDKGKLSAETIHKAEVIEKLARSIKEKMSTSVIPN
jgi:hypothetical protein